MDPECPTIVMEALVDLSVNLSIYLCLVVRKKESPVILRTKTEIFPNLLL